MKILILCNNDGGIYNLRKELVEKLIQQGNEVYVSCPEGNRTKDLIEMGCKFINTALDRRKTNVIKDFKLLMFYKKIITEINPNIVLTYTIKPNIYGGIICRYKKVPYICNITGLGTALENESALQKILLFLYRIALKNVRCCFVQNKENLKFLKNNRVTKDDRYRLIPGSGVNLNHFKVLPYPEEKEKIKFIFIGRILKEKGIDEYLQAAKYITKKYCNTEFHILGLCEEEYKGRLQEFENEKIIYYHGLKKDVIPYLKESSCLIHPSYYPEGMSNVLLEASASGRPVITTNRAGCKEIVDEGKNGFIIEIKNTEQLIQKLEKFVNLPRNQREKMGLKGRRKMEKEFDRNIIVNAYLKEISRIQEESDGL